MSSEASESGFTLIELVVVIVIIGILAAAALPRFVDLTSEAEKSAAQGVAGSITGAAAMVRGKWLGQGSSGDSVDLQTGSVTVNSSTGYPQHEDSAIKAILQQNPASTANWELVASNNSDGGAVLQNTGSGGWKVLYSSSSGTVSALAK